jgi:hypothetical protein
VTGIGSKELFKFEIVEEPSEVYNVTDEVNVLATIYI